MIHLTHTIAGTECHIYYPESADDLGGFERFLARGDRVVALDTETSGLDIYSRGFKLRLVQFGNDREAWVLRADMFRDAIVAALRQDRFWTIHNAAYDLKVFDWCLGVRLEELCDKVADTRILAHLIDPRSEQEGGAGLGLKALSGIYVDPDAPDTQKGLHALFRTITNPVTGRKCTKETGWAHIPIDNELYIRYAGLDVILGTRVFYALAPIVCDLGLDDLSEFEHHFQILCCVMERKGVLVDVDYVRKLDAQLEQEAEHFRKVANRYGVANVNSTAQVAEALLGTGETLTETTDSGAIKVDKAVLLPLADLDPYWNRLEAREPNPLANAVLHAKRAEKWRTSYVQAFLDLRDPNDRLHAQINSLQARTARMSISRPPLQQLPSGDWKVRRAMVADPGQLMMASDYDQVELRVLAAMADVKGLKEAIANGDDLHSFAATRVFGPDFTKQQRKLAKMVGFGKVYGGGVATLTRQTGADVESVRKAVAAYDAAFPEIKRYAAKLQRRADYGKKEVVTRSGRHLPLDKDRLYAATNYVVQSTARDVLAQAIVDMFEAGLGDHLLLPVHDEVIAEAPASEAEEVARAIGEVMTTTLDGVAITSAGEVTGKNWGSAYGADPEEGSW